MKEFCTSVTRHKNKEQDKGAVPKKRLSHGGVHASSSDFISFIPLSCITNLPLSVKCISVVMEISWLRSSSTSSGVLGSSREIWRSDSVGSSAASLGFVTSGLFSFGGSVCSLTHSSTHLYESKDLDFDAFMCSGNISVNKDRHLPLPFRLTNAVFLSGRDRQCEGN